MFDQLLQDVRVSSRSLRRRPGFTSVAVLTLALGAGVTTAIFSVTYGILLRPLPYANSDRIVMLWQTARDNPQPSPGGSTSHLNYLDWRRDAKSFESMALYSSNRFMFTGGDATDVIRGGIVTPGFFEAFHATPIRGRTFRDSDDLAKGPRVAMVSYGLWQERLGGRPDVVGSSIEISGRSWEIIGVAPPGFDFPNKARIWTPIQNDDTQCGRNCVYTDGVARLRPGVSVNTARDEMDGIARQLEAAYPNANTNVAVGIASLRDAMVGDIRPALRILFAAVLMVLLIACANVANLLLARGTSRHTEMAVRAALGAGRGRLLKQMTVESVSLAAVGASVGLLLAIWGIKAIKTLAPAGVPRLDEVGLDLPTLAFAVLVVLVTAGVFGLAPALQLARVPLITSLHGSNRSTVGTAGRAKFGLLVAEVALSLVLLLGAGLLLRSFIRLQHIDPGWSASGVSTFRIALPPARYADGAAVVTESDDLAARLAAIPGVERVARIRGLPLGNIVNVLEFTRADRPQPRPGEVPTVLYRTVDEAFFDVMRIPILKGRTFTNADRAGAPPVLIISRAMAERYWPGEDPIGKPVQIGGPPNVTIVGVVADIRSETLAGPPQPEMYRSIRQTADRAFSFVLKNQRDPSQVLTDAREVVRRFDAKLPLFDVATMQQMLDDATARPRFYLLLVGLFAVLALVLAAVGIYGVVAYMVGQRTREIGVRMALGAEARAVIGLVLWQGMRPALIGVFIGLATALAGARLMQSMLYETTPHDVTAIAGATALLLVMVMLACLVPGLRATRIEPTTALRAE